MRSAGRFTTPALAAVLLLIYVGLATSAARHKSNTFDEIAHVTAGYAYWVLNDYRLHPENGNWPQRLGSLPAVASAPRFVPPTDPGWRGSDAYAVGEQFFFTLGNDIDEILWRGRIVIALLGAALGAIVFLWSRRLHGAAGGWISLVLFVFSPTMLAHGALVTSDMAAALAFTAATGAWWILLHRVTPATLALSAIAMAALFLSKFSAPIIILVAAGLTAVRLISRAPLSVTFPTQRVDNPPGAWGPTPTRAHAAAGLRPAPLRRRARAAGAQLWVVLALGVLHVLVAAASIWASYGFRYTAFHEGPAPGERLLVEWPLVLSGPDGATPSLTGRAIDWARERRLLPEAYLYGLAHSVKFSRSRRAFMHGEFSTTGWRLFFPFAFAVKTTVPLLALLALAAAASLHRRRQRAGSDPLAHGGAGAYARAPLWLLLIVYGCFAITTNLNIGHRHLLPIYPALFILAGGAGYWLTFLRRRSSGVPAAAASNRRRGRGGHKQVHRRSMGVAVGTASILLIGWHVVESFAVRPHYLAYFNTLVGGPGSGYRLLVDSSLDWGQDLPGLKTWLDRNVTGQQPQVPVYLSYFGTGSPVHHGIDAVLLPGYFDRRTSVAPVPLTAGWYCVSATMLQAVYLAASGPWTAEYEAQYQSLNRPAVELLRAIETNDRARVNELLAQHGESGAVRLLEAYDQLRTARLMAYLRQREPTATVGYSILIYRLSDADIAQALFGPSPHAGSQP